MSLPNIFAEWRRLRARLSRALRARYRLFWPKNSREMMK